MSIGLLFRGISITGMCAALAACGSGGTSTGGGGSAPTPVPTGGQAPQFTTTADAFTVVENIAPSTVVGAITATDPEGAAIAYTLAGADAGDLTIDTGGGLHFAVAPNYDLPADDAQDNIYNVDVVASDGFQTTRKSIKITVTNDREGVSSARWNGDRTDWFADRPVGAFYYGSASSAGGIVAMLAAERAGRLRLILGVGDPGTVRTITAVDPARGIIAMVPAADFATSGTFYVMFNSTAGNIEIRRFNRAFLDNPASSEPATAILSVPHTENANNVGGWMGFGPDGLLNVALPDGGGTGDPLGRSQSDTSRLGKVLRLSADFGTVTVLAKGLRNPSGGTFYNNMLVVGDQGEAAREEVDLIPLDAANVLNLGWPFREGTLTVRTGGPAGLTDPIIECPHGLGTRGCYGIVGGDIYTGGNAQLQNKYLFADRDYQGRGGFIFAVPLARLVFGQPTIQAAEFENRTLDVFGAHPYVLNPTSFFRVSGANWIVDETTVSLRGALYRIN